MCPAYPTNCAVSTRRASACETSASARFGDHDQRDRRDQQVARGGEPGIRGSGAAQVAEHQNHDHRQPDRYGRGAHRRQCQADRRDSRRHRHGHGQEKVTRFPTVAALEAKLAGTQATPASPMGRPRSGGPLERSWKRQTAESLSQTSHAPEVAGSRAAVPIGERPRSAWLAGRDSVVYADEYR
jgi:hypothetical protein